MRDLRTEKVKKKAEADQRRSTREHERMDAARSAIADGVWRSIKCMPIEALDFKLFEYKQILVTDGSDVALAEVHRRFGRPIRVIKEPEMAFTDNGVAMIGGEYEEIDAPAWWFEWELTDLNGNMTYAGGEETGKTEVEFVATHWLPLPAGLY